MTRVFTHNDLIRYIYGETTPDESLMIEALIASDPGFKELYEELKEIEKNVESFAIEPPAEIVENILQYVRINDLHSVE